MQFSYNSDYPGFTPPPSHQCAFAAQTQAQNSNQNINDSLPRDPYEFPPANPIPCARITTRVFHPIRNRVEIVHNVLVRTVNMDMCTNTLLFNYASSSDSDGDDSMYCNTIGDGTSEQRQQLEQYEIKHAYWIQTTIREANFGLVWFAVVLKRRPRHLTTMDGAEWEVTPDHCAVKEMSWDDIRRGKSCSVEDPMKEVAAMQHVHRLWRNAVVQQQQQQQQQQENTTPASSTNNYHADVAQSFSAMRGTNIMMPLDLLSDERYLYSIMPYCDGGELFERLDLNDRFSEDEARYWMDQVLNGLDNLQKVGICHRDISLENLLVHKDGALIIDMGMCLLVPYCDDDNNNSSNNNNNEDRTTPTTTNTTAGVSASSRLPQHPIHPHSHNPLSGRLRRRSLIRPQGTCGKWMYMSPEICRNEEPFDGFAVDMWAAGVILFTMLTGYPPWEYAMPSDDRFRFMAGGFLVQMLTEWNTGLSCDAMDLLQRMLFLDPRDRLSLDQVRAHPWMVNGRRGV